MSRPADIICFCGQDWWYHNRAHSDFQLMTRAAKSRRVLLVNSIGMRMPIPGRSTLPMRRIFRKFKSMLRHLRRPLPELPDYWVLSPVLLPLYSSARGREWNARAIRWQVERAARAIGIERAHVFVTVPTAWDVAKHMPRASLCYNRSDKHSAFGEADNAMVVGLERQLLQNADLVIYSSRAFLESEGALTADRARFLDHGVDLAHFGSVRRPTNVLTSLGIKRPIIGFFGGLDDYVIDFELLEKVARAFPQASLVLIGDATLAMDRLTALPNVHHHGFRPYSEIPALGGDFDVAIMPWLDNDWIRCCNPIKLKEYLALGLEVVTTWFPEAEHYREHLHIGRSHDEFLAAINGVLQGSKSPGQRKALLAGATWDDRATAMLELLDDAAERRCSAKEQTCAAS